MVTYSTYELIFALIIGAPFFVFFATFILNIPFFLRLNQSHDAVLSDAQQPFVSLLVPARNEDRVIGRLLTHLTTQTYQNYEIILLDDNSTDRTRAIAQQIKEASQDVQCTLTIIDGKPLPEGWLGKNWACHQLAEQAQGDVLIFIDADVICQPAALASTLYWLDRCDAGMLSVFPTQLTDTWGERLTVPLISLAVLCYLPLVGVHFIPWSGFAAANGQCIAFRRETYIEMGGHAAVRAAIIEDVALSRLAKKRRHRLRIVDGNQIIQCRMYHSWQEVLDGFSKNIVAGFGNIGGLVASMLFHWLIFLAPWVWLFISLIADTNWLFPLILIVAGITIRALAAWRVDQRPQDALLMPLSVLLITRIAWQGIMWRLRGQIQWKGRIITD